MQIGNVTNCENSKYVPQVNDKRENLSDSKSDYSQILRKTIEEMEQNVKNGTIPKPAVSIGSRVYTDKEWGKLMDKVDDAIESAKEAAEDKAEKMDREREKKEVLEKE